MLEYLQQLQDKILEEKATFLEDAKRFQIMGPKCKKVLLETDIDCRPFKKAREKQPARY